MGRPWVDWKYALKNQVKANDRTAGLSRATCCLCSPNKEAVGTKPWCAVATESGTKWDP